MSETTNEKLIRLEGKIDNLTGSNENIVKRLDKDFVTQDQLKLVVQEFKPYKTLVLWLLTIVAAETVALLFFLIRSLIENN